MTPAEQLVAPSHALNGSLPDWAQELRRAGRDAFLQAGLPTPRDEEWKYTNVAALAKSSFALATDDAAIDLTPLLPPPLGGPRLVFVNGRPVAAASLLPARSGVTVSTLADAAAARPDLLQRHLGSVADIERQPFVALNTAFLDQGVVIHLDADVEYEEAIEVVFATLGEAAVTVQPRVLVVAATHARATLVERYVGAGTTPYFTNAVTEVDLADGATLRHVRIQEEAETGFHIGSVLVRQAAASHFASSVVSLGAGLARTDIRTYLEGRGAECDLDGLYIARGRQHVDHQTLIDHRVPQATSRELYKGVLDDAATGVFGGRVFVREDAQKSDAQQMNKNLLLSDAATVDTKPQLEIFADDVKCSHGATIGRLDDAALFYLRSRGIEAARARQILVRAFAEEMVERIPVAALRDGLGRSIGARFATVAAAA